MTGVEAAESQRGQLRGIDATVMFQTIA